MAILELLTTTSLKNFSTALSVIRLFAKPMYDFICVNKAFTLTGPSTSKTASINALYLSLLAVDTGINSSFNAL